MEELEELITCSICLERFNNPKLLPCQHSFCMEPCLRIVVDNQKIPCPVCRAEYQLPPNGLDDFPTNKTLEQLSKIDNRMENISGVMEQLNNLLTCVKCMKRSQHPRLLPCQHSICMEPCLSSISDFINQLVKCPVCRVQHALPEDGIKGFPNDLTLQGFLDLQKDYKNEERSSKPLNGYGFGSRGNAPGCFQRPRGIAITPDNFLIVADSLKMNLQLFDEIGDYQRSFGVLHLDPEYKHFNSLTGVAISRCGNIIVADEFNHRIHVLDPTGKFIYGFGSLGDDDGQFVNPYGVAMSASDVIVVCDKGNNRIQVFDPNGVFIFSIGSVGRNSGEFNSPSYATIGNNKIYVSDTNNHRIQVFHISGQHLHSFGLRGSKKGELWLPRGLALTSDGSLIVADSGNNRIQVFSELGVFKAEFGRFGSRLGEFIDLEDVAIMPDSDIVVSDSGNHRIQKFPGTFITELPEE